MEEEEKEGRRWRRLSSVRHRRLPEDKDEANGGGAQMAGGLAAVAWPPGTLGTFSSFSSQERRFHKSTRWQRLCHLPECRVTGFSLARERSKREERKEEDPKDTERTDRLMFHSSALPVPETSCHCLP